MSRKNKFIKDKAHWVNDRVSTLVFGKDPNDLEFMYIKNLPSADVLSNNKRNKEAKTTHIAVTSASQKFFNEFVVGTETNNNWNIYNVNLFDFDKSNLGVQQIAFTKDSGKDQIKISASKYNSETFNAMRKQMNIGDYFVFAKYNDGSLYATTFKNNNNVIVNVEENILLMADVNYANKLGVEIEERFPIPSPLFERAMFNAYGHFGETETKENEANIIKYVGYVSDEGKNMLYSIPKLNETESSEFSYRTRWTRTKLKEKGLLSKRERGFWNLSEEGRRIFTDYIEENFTEEDQFSSSSRMASELLDDNKFREILEKQNKREKPNSSLEDKKISSFDRESDLSVSHRVMVWNIQQYFKNETEWDAITEVSNIDVLVKRGDVFQLIEVKSYNKRSAVFEAIGQLAHYSRLLQEKIGSNGKIHPKIIISGVPSDELLKTCSGLGIEMENYFEFIKPIKTKDYFLEFKKGA